MGAGAGEPVLAALDESVSFDRHIKSLFRRFDRQSMRGAFDLWSYEDVSEHADAIAQRVHAGTMPCDVARSDEYVAAFQRWIDEGKRP